MNFPMNARSSSFFSSPSPPSSSSSFFFCCCSCCCYCCYCSICCVCSSSYRCRLGNAGAGTAVVVSELILEKTIFCRSMSPAPSKAATSSVAFELLYQ
ncbi:hypothetical protein ASPBRDRAFT_383679 [Aspergillus brasiliensis CBS 101740]|uniref:Uncharacterized protein n=1 Tax=Aspergillus brasiliensis (strain CBS 101740 / IMI 381727 / IBT 21946) TaxID=767769 RepID=A0A1L9UVU9_ASPBC|nr:hypothetical protein ASPBRDRAFT_383679 [Aspergillus brasiliensis CBS 101740]